MPGDGCVYEGARLIIKSKKEEYRQALLMEVNILQEENTALRALLEKHDAVVEENKAFLTLLERYEDLMTKNETCQARKIALERELAAQQAKNKCSRKSVGLLRKTTILEFFGVWALEW